VLPEAVLPEAVLLETPEPPVELPAPGL
jgi:hypothetical protein